MKSKPLTSAVESDGRPDSVVADEAWRVYKKRNDSVIVDLFQGQYKSTLVCPSCRKVWLIILYLYLTIFKIFFARTVKNPLTLSRRQKAFFPHQSARGASAVFLKKKNYKVKVKNFFTRARKNYSFYELIVAILKLNVKNNYCWQWRGHKILFMWPFLKNSGILILIGLILNYLFIFIYSN